MANITIRNLDDDVKTRLRVRSTEHHRPDPGQNPPFRKMAVANHAPAPVLQPLLLVCRKILLELRRHRRRDQLPGALAEQVGQRVGNRGWRRKRNHAIFAYVRCAPLVECWIV